MILTPPKPDHPIHYAEYQKRLLNRPSPEPTAVPPDYDRPEPIVAVTATRDGVTVGRGGVKVGEVQPSITRCTDVIAVIPYTERY